MTALIYTNHAGTTNESFTIGKRGIKLLQSSGDPSGVSAPAGSLYVRKDTASLYQMGGSNNWNSILTINSVTTDSTLSLTYSNNNSSVQIGVVPTSYLASFTNENLVANTLTVTHDLNQNFPMVQVWNNENSVMQPDSITAIDANAVVIDFTTALSSSILTGNWHARISV